MAAKQPPVPPGNNGPRGPGGPNPKGPAGKPGSPAAAKGGATTKGMQEIPEPEMPPEPSVFLKYSQHHEFPLSTMASILSHGLVLIMAMLAAGMLIHWGGDREPPEVDVLVFAGGGGDGEGGGKVDGEDDLKEVITFDPSRMDNETPTVTFNKDDISSSVAETTKERIIEEARSAERVARGADPTKRAGDIGRGGPGSGGGLGSGHGTGEGSGSGPGKMSERLKRPERWTLQIPYTTGEEYRDKLANLNAMIAFPEGKTQFRLFRDLSKKTSTVETQQGLGGLGRVWWNDSDPERVSGLAGSLGATGNPKVMFIFLPRDLEKELLKRELEYAKKTEAQLNEQGIETWFTAEKVGASWNVKVVKQEKKRRGR
jgi:hypothetical protein